MKGRKRFRILRQIERFLTEQSFGVTPYGQMDQRKHVRIGHKEHMVKLFQEHMVKLFLRSDQ